MPNAVAVVVAVVAVLAARSQRLIFKLFGVVITAF
jgi:hypothetical protein